MWEMGHSFEEIDKLALQDMGDVIAYWSQNQKIEKKRQDQQKAKNKAKKGGK